LNTDHASQPTVITRDNLHLSEPIPTAAIARAVVSNPLSLCTDPKVLEFIAAATSANTLRAYASDLAHFHAWGGSIPAEPVTVAQYLATHAENLSVATLARRLVAVRRAHVLGGFTDPAKTELVRLTIRGIRRRHGRPQRRVAPLKIDQLAEIVSRLGSATRDVRDRALLLVGFTGAFRRSELCAIDHQWIERAGQGVILTLRRSKTDQEGRGRSVAIPHIGGPLCPDGALHAWLHVSGNTDGPLFRPVGKSGAVLTGRLSTSAVAMIVKQRVSLIGLDPNQYSGHSLRAGFATSAAAAGLSAWEIKGRTGHVSDAVLGSYIREADLFKSVATIWSRKLENTSHVPLTTAAWCSTEPSG
jgi:site-specific recombinase XerD